jgi:hypothetical protein
MDPRNKAELRYLDRLSRKRRLTPQEGARRFEILRDGVERDRALWLQALSPLADLATMNLSDWTERAAAFERDAEMEMGIDPILWGENVGAK